MTIAELIDQLSKLDSSLQVVIASDHYGDLSSLQLVEKISRPVTFRLQGGTSVEVSRRMPASQEEDFLGVELY